MNRLSTLAALLTLSVAMTLPAPAQDPVELDVSSRSYLSPSELAVWNDPDFQRQFAESYIAETEIEPRVTVEERELLQEVLDLMGADQLDKAARMLKEEVEGNEAASPVFDYMLANIYFQQEKLDQAATYYKTAVEEYPKFRRAWKNLGIIHVRQSEFKEAIPALTRVIELGGQDAVTFGLLAFSYSSVENHLSAEAGYRYAILLDPDTLDWKMGLARSFFKQQRYAEAAALCGQLIEQYPDRADLWLLQANAYIGMEKPLEAAEVYELIDHLGKSSFESLNMLGDIYINEELYELAASAYIRAIEKEAEKHSDRAIRAARILAARAAYDEAERMVEQIQSIYGEQLEAQQQKDLLKIQARLAVADGEAEEEVRVLKEIVELDPLDGEALILLGQHASRTGDSEQAIFYFERAANIEGHEADAKVRHAQVLVKEGRYSEALPLLRRAQQIKPRENVQQYLEQVERVAKTR